MKPSGEDAERRRHRRYPVKGTLALEAGEARYDGVPVNLSLGGVLFQAEPAPREQTQGTLRLNVDGCEQAVSGEVRVIRAHGNASVAIFLTGSVALVKCVKWLARQQSETADSSSTVSMPQARRAKVSG